MNETLEFFDALADLVENVTEGFTEFYDSFEDHGDAAHAGYLVRPGEARVVTLDGTRYLVTVQAAR